MNFFVTFFLGIHVSNAICSPDSQNYSKNSDKEGKTIITAGKELEQSEAKGNELKKKLLETKPYINIRATHNDYKFNIVNIFQKRKIKHNKVHSNIEKEEEQFFGNSSNSSRLFGKLINVLENEPHSSFEKSHLSKYESEIKYSGEKNENPLSVDNHGFESFDSTKEVDINEQESDDVSMLTSAYQYQSPLVIFKTLVPRTIVKRSSPSASTKQLENPSTENFPFSVAGSSLYGTYAYAHSRPPGFGMFPPSGGEEEQIGEPVEGGEEEGKM